MTDTTERKLAIAMEALHRIGEVAGSRTKNEEARHALARIAALDTPPTPDLAEIGAETFLSAPRDGMPWQKAGGHWVVYRAQLEAAYAAMRAVDPLVQKLLETLRWYGEESPLRL